MFKFNTFLSTSKNRDVSVLFAESNVSDPNLVGILFVMNIDSTQSTIPFACITDVSYFEINLTLTNDNDQDLRRLTDRIRAETISDIGGWFRLGLILLKMGEFDKAEQLYQILLEQTNDEGDKPALYNQLGCAKHNQREYDEVIIYYEKAFEIGKKFLPSSHPDMATIYNSIGGVYYNMDQYPKALSFYRRAVEIGQQSLPSNHPHLQLYRENLETAKKNK